MDSSVMLLPTVIGCIFLAITGCIVLVLTGIVVGDFLTRAKQWVVSWTKYGYELVKIRRDLKRLESIDPGDKG